MMGRKRKSESSPLDEVDRTLYTTFCTAANSLSQLYSQAVNHQKLSFQAGERHALEKLYQWILRQHEEGSRVTVADILSHVQNEIDYGEDALISTRLSSQHQLPQAVAHSAHSSFQPSSGLFGQATTGLTPRSGNSDQSKNSVFSNALSSPVRQSLQPYHLAQGGGYDANGLSAGSLISRNHELSREREANSLNSNDTTMDMHSDSPAHESY